MKKIIIFIVLVSFSSVYAAGHLSEKDRKATLKCAGLYYANSMIPQGTLELDKIVFSIAAKKYLTSYLIKEGVKEDFINSELNKSVDDLYGKTYDKKKRVIAINIFINWYQNLKRKSTNWLNQEFIKNLRRKNGR